MTNPWNDGSATYRTAASNDGGSDGRTRNDRWLRRPRRSSGDRKIAGVAGGVGRAFGIDPVLIRVIFVVLTIFGGVGGLLYVLGWLLLPADGDEVSAAEALVGRGRSSVAPPLAVGLGVVAVIAAFSMFSWGLPFLPLAIGGVIVLTVMRKRGRLSARSHRSHRDWPNDDWPNWSDFDRRAGAGARDRPWQEQIDDWAAHIRREARSGHWGRPGGGPWSGCGSSKYRGGWGGSTAAGSTVGSSPFQQPAFWEQPVADTPTGPDDPAAGGPVDLTKGAAPAALDEPLVRTTPPAWDPLGVAPFAWDLPEPTPLAAPTTSPGTGVIARVALGVTLLVGGLTAAGVFAGWWALTWAQVSGIALGVLAVGLLVSALRGRGYSLIGPGVFLSLVTLALAVTGVSGTSGYGATQFAPATLAELQPSYSANAGELQLDLSSITIPKGGSRTVDVELKAGNAVVSVPAGLTVVAECSAQVGRTDCLGQSSDGLQKTSTGRLTGNADSGTLTVNVKVNAGVAEVRTNG